MTAPGGGGADEIREQLAEQAWGALVAAAQDGITDWSVVAHAIAGNVLSGPLALLLDLRQRVEGLADSWEALAAEYDGAAAAITTPSLIEEARGHAEDIRASVGGLRRALDGTP